jgi:molecular chaperone Hsp33
MSSVDTVVRAISEDGGFRVIAAVTTQTSREVVRSQRVEGDVAVSLGELVTGAVLVRETMAPDLRVQVILKGLQGELVADAFPQGKTRGLARIAPSSDPGWESGPWMRVMRTMPNARIQEGIVQVLAGASVSDALSTYMAQSEQSVCVVGSCARVVHDGIEASAGFVVQLLPEVEKGALSVMTERLERLPFEQMVRPGLAADALLEELLAGIPHAMLDQSGVAFGCTCTPDKVLAGIATLGQAEIADILVRGEVLECECDYCRREFRIGPDQVAKLLRGGGEA